jgi:hypothetical protein
MESDGRVRDPCEVSRTATQDDISGFECVQGHATRLILRSLSKRQ